MKALVVCKHPEGSVEASACRIIKKEGLQTIYSWKNTLTKKQLEDVDLVISIGGDGTALSASHYILDKPILAVNSNPKKSEGALTSIPLEKLEEKLDEILAGKVKEEKHERIQISINDIPLEILALNEVFVSHEKPYLISSYELKYKSISEIQKSSGVIISTGTGSTAWFKSAGGTPFKVTDKNIKLIVREPFEGNLSKVKNKKITINEGEEVQIQMCTPGILAIDSIREIKLKDKDCVKISISPLPLRKIV